MLYNGKITLFEFTLLKDPLHKRKVMMMVLAFVMSWMPFVLIYFTKLFGMRNADSKTFADIFPLFCVKLGSTIINPMIYRFERRRVCVDSVLDFI